MGKYVGHYPAYGRSWILWDGVIINWIGDHEYQLGYLVIILCDIFGSLSVLYCVGRKRIILLGGIIIQILFFLVLYKTTQ